MKRWLLCFLSPFLIVPRRNLAVSVSRRVLSGRIATAIFCGLGIIAGGLGFSPTSAMAQGVLIVEDPAQVILLPRPVPSTPRPIPRPIPPRPTVSYHVAKIDVQAKITDAAAEVQLSQTFVNDGQSQIEAAFVFPLPYDSAVTEMTLMVDGKELTSKIMKANETRDYYESIVRRNQDPALLEWIGHGLFRTNVFPIPAGAKRTVTLRYVQVLRRSDGLTDFLLPLATARYSTKPVDQIQLRIAIGSDAEIRNVWSPSHNVKTERPTPKDAVVTFSEEQKTPSCDFRLLYDVGHETIGAKLMSYRPTSEDDGFFALFAAPAANTNEEIPSVPKTVVLVIDRSGSMNGEKMKQAREALRFVLEQLQEGDLFNIVAYDSRVESFRPELQRIDSETKQAAIGFVEGLYAGGSTNIGEALKTAFAPLNDPKRPTYVLFLTDGCPTTGITNESELLELSTESNHCGARLMVFGVGYDVNSRLLDRMAKNGRGLPVYVRPEEHIEEQVSSLWRKIGSPVLTDVAFEIQLDEPSDDAALVNRVYPSGKFDLFSGEQMVIVGRYRRAGSAKVVLTGTWNGEPKTWDFPATLADSGDTTTSFVEPLWAMRRVTEILDEIDANGTNDELVKELIDLATRHGIVTPYTSFLADETSETGVTAQNVARSESRLRGMSVAGGSFGVEQRRMRQNMRSQQNLAFDSDSFADRDVAKAMAAAPELAASAPRATAQSASGMGARMSKSGSAGLGSRNDSEHALGLLPSPAVVPDSDISRSEDEITQAATTIRRVGDRTFYLRQGIWIDGTLSESQQSEQKPIVIKQFTPEMFEFIRNHSAISQYLVFDETVLLNVDGTVYRIEKVD